MPNRLSAGCCCQDCSCRQMLFDFRQDWHDAIEVTAVQDGNRTHGVTVVFDVAEQTGFGIVDGNVPRIRGFTVRVNVNLSLFLAGSFLNSMSYPQQVGFVRENGFILPTTVSDFDAIFNARFAAGTNVTSAGLPVPTTATSRYVMMWKPSVNFTQSPDTDSFTLFSVRQMTVASFIGGTTLIDWRQELIRESEGQFRTKNPLPSLPVSVGQLFDFAPVISSRPLPRRLTTRTLVEIYTKDENGEETSIFNYRSKTILAPPATGIYEKYKNEWVDEFVASRHKTILYWLNSFQRVRSSNASPATSGDVFQFPQFTGGQWELSESELGEVIHYHSIGTTQQGSFVQNISRVGLSHSNWLSPDLLRIERDRIRVHSGVINGSELHFGARAIDYFVDLEEPSKPHLRIKTLEGTPLEGMRLQSEVGQRGENVNCPPTEYNQQTRRLINRFVAKSLTFDGSEYTPKITITDDKLNQLSFAGMSLLPRLPEFSTCVPQVMSVFGRSGSLESNTLVNIDISVSWENGAMVGPSSLPEIPQEINFAFCEPAIRLPFGHTQVSVASLPSILATVPTEGQRLLANGFRFYRGVNGQWTYLGQQEIPNALERPSQAEAAVIASQLLEAESPHDEYWYSFCGKYYSINANGETLNRDATEFTRFNPEVEVLVALHAPFRRETDSLGPTEIRRFFREVNNTTPIQLDIASSGSVVPASFPGIVYSKIVDSFDPYNPPTITFKVYDLIQSTYLSSQLAGVMATELSTAIFPQNQVSPPGALLVVYSTARAVPLSSIEVTIGPV